MNPAEPLRTTHQALADARRLVDLAVVGTKLRSLQDGTLSVAPLVESGEISETDAFDWLYETALINGLCAGSWREGVKHVIRMGLDGKRAEPPLPLMRELPPADPFPIDALGSVLAPAARAIHDRTQAPLATCGQSVLAAATLAVQAHANVVLPTGQSRPLNSYFMTIAATGERKTAVDKEALRPIRQREATLHKGHVAEQRDYENAKLAWEKTREVAIKSGKGDRVRIKAALDAIGPPPVQPLVPLLTCSEPTFEGITKLFGAGWPSLGIFAGEGGQFIGGHSMADEAKLRTAAGLSAAWDGEPFKRVRSGDGVSVLCGRRLAMHLMAQPEVAGTMLNDGLLNEQGLLSRILTTAPDAASGTRTWREPSPETEVSIQRYSAQIFEILELPLPLVSSTQNELDPRALPMSLDAKRLWIGFYNHLENRLGSGGELESIRGFANKLPEHAARIAAVLALVQNIQATEIGTIEMQAGIDLAQHYAAEALRLNASSVTVEMRNAKRLLDWLILWPEDLISLPDVYQHGPNSIRDMATARKVVGLLVRHGWLVEGPGGVIVDGKRRREAWRIIRG